jgi:hypothetical protein
MATMSWPLPITAPGDGIRITHQTASKTPAPAQIHATSKPATASVPPYAELGIFGSGDDAIGAWAGLKQLNATLLAGYQPTVTLVTTHGDPAWHLRAVGFTGPADADRFCTQMRIASQGCTIGSSP